MKTEHADDDLPQSPAAAAGIEPHPADICPPIHPAHQPHMLRRNCALAGNNSAGRAREAAVRLERCRTCCPAIREIAANCGDIRGAAFDAACQLLAKCAARALSFDERLCPLPEMKATIAQHEQELRATMASLLGQPATDTAWKQACLPGPLAGLGLHQPGSTADGAAWASWFTTQTLCQVIAAELGAPLYPHEPMGEVREACERMRDQGIWASEAGDAGLAQSAAETLEQVSWLAADVTPKYEQHLGRQPTHRLL